MKPIEKLARACVLGVALLLAIAGIATAQETIPGLSDERKQKLVKGQCQFQWNTALSKMDTMDVRNATLAGWSWNDPDRTVTWSGTCSGGFADGQGTLKSSEGEETHTGTGTYSNGKQHGSWVWHQADGTVAEGLFVDGKRHDRWIVRYAKRIVAEAEGPFVDGEMLGQWVLRHANGTSKGPLVDGKPHGRWVVEHRDGTVTEPVYVDGRPGC